MCKIKFIFIIILLFILSCKVDFKPILVQRNDQINETSKNEIEGLLEKLNNYSKNNKKEEFSNLYLDEIKIDIRNNFNNFSSFKNISNKRVVESEKYLYSIGIRKNDNYIDKGVKVFNTFYPDIIRSFDKLFVNYNLIKFDCCEYIETIVMTNDEDYKIIYHIRFKY